MAHYFPGKKSVLEHIFGKEKHFNERSTVQHGFLKYSGETGCVRECCFPMFNKEIKQAELFRGTELLLMVLIAGLDDRILTSFSLWLGSIVAKPIC